MHQRFWMWFHDWQSHLQGNEVVPASLAASRQPRSQDSQSAGGVEDKAEDVLTKKITARVKNSHSQALLFLQSWRAFLPHCFHPYFNIYGLYPMCLELCKVLRIKRRLSFMVPRANGWGRSKASSPTGDERGRFLPRKVGLRSKRERLNILTSSQRAALTGCSLDFSISGEPSSHSLCKVEELSDWISEATDLDIVYLDRT